jgi:hypothetical protein
MVGASGTIRTAALALALVALLTAPVSASERRDLFIDDEDGAFDMSEVLLTERGFLPIPLLITEPAVGYGLGAVPVWFHEPPRVIGVERKQLVLPSASALGAFATADGSWGVFGSHLRSWNDDTWRYVGGVG